MGRYWFGKWGRFEGGGGKMGPEKKRKRVVKRMGKKKERKKRERGPITEDANGNQGGATM